MSLRYDRVLCAQFSRERVAIESRYLVPKNLDLYFHSGACGMLRTIRNETRLWYEWILIIVHQITCLGLMIVKVDCCSENDRESQFWWYELANAFGILFILNERGCLAKSRALSSVWRLAGLLIHNRTAGDAWPTECIDDFRVGRFGGIVPVFHEIVGGIVFDVCSIVYVVCRWERTCRVYQNPLSSIIVDMKKK